MRNKNLIYQPDGCIFGCVEFHEYSISLEDLVDSIKAGNESYDTSPFHVVTLFNPAASGVSSSFEYNSIDMLRSKISEICRYRELIISPKFDEIYEEVCYFEFDEKPCVGMESNIITFDLGLIYNQYNIPDKGQVIIRGFTHFADWPSPLNRNSKFSKIGYFYGTYEMIKTSGLYTGLDGHIGCIIYPYYTRRKIGTLSFEECTNYTIPIALLSSNKDEINSQMKRRTRK